MADHGVSEEGSSSLKRRNLRCDGEAAVYIARCPSHFGGLHSNRLTRRRQAIGSFFSPERIIGRAVSQRDYKKASVEEEKKFFPIQASSTQYE